MIYFHGFGHFHPENKIDNAFLESLDIGTNEQWIVDRVGIKSRRTVLPLDYIRATKNADIRAAKEAALYTNAETGRRAAMMAIERAGIKPSDIGMVLAGGCSPDTCIPAEGARIANALGMSGPAFDLHSACSTFGAQVHFVNQLGTNAPDYVLLVSPENTTRVINFADRASAVLFGDGTSAAVVSTKHSSRCHTKFSTFNVNAAGCDEVMVPRTGHFHQNGSAVQKFAIKQMTALLTDIQTRVGEDRAQKLVYIGHQANLTMLESVCRRCEIPTARHYRNIVEYGNQCAAGAPIVMSQNWDTFQPGDVVAMVVVGSGLSWSSLQLEFT
jgi:3-oxoacyl-[acyl-carrier-protein] synthase III